jgi:ribosomal protein L24
MTERPSKRRRIAVSYTTNAMTIGADVEGQNGNPFVDLEALADEESAGEDEQGCEGIVLTGSTRVLCINGQILLADEPQVDDQGNADGPGGHVRLHHAYEEQEMDDTEIWDDFYMRILARSQNRERRGGENGDDTGNILGDDTDDLLGDGTGDFLGDDTEDILWELGCLVCDFSFTKMDFNLNYFQPGCEEVALRKIEQEISEHFVHTHPLIPGRIFADVDCETARHLAETIPELQRWVRPVRPYDLKQLIIETDETAPPPPTTAAPLTTTAPPLTTTAPPLTTTAPPLTTTAPRLTRKAPTSSQLPIQTGNAILKNGDRVKILGGDYRDVIGIVKDVCEHEYVVHLPSQDLDETFQQHLVRAAFRPGDEVKVLDGPHTGITGWVVNVGENEISLMNMQKQLEVREPISHPCAI